jgi:hypothetical protein
MALQKGFSPNFKGVAQYAIPNGCSISVSSPSASTLQWGETKQTPPSYKNRKGAMIGTTRISIIPGFNVLFLLATLILLMTLVPFIGQHMLSPTCDTKINLTSTKGTRTTDSSLNLTRALRHVAVNESGSENTVSTTRATSAIPMTTKESVTSLAQQPNGLDVSLPFIHVGTFLSSDDHFFPDFFDND